MEHNIFGYPIVNPKSMDRFFGRRPYRMKEDQFQWIKSKLNSLDVPIPVDYNKDLLNYEIPVPPLLGKNIYEHYELAAQEFIGDSVHRVDNFIKTNVPEFPCPLLEYKSGKLLFNGQEIKSGWTKIDYKTWSIEPVSVPEEDVFIFDTETFVKHHNYPIMGTAVSSKAYYLWLAKEVLAPSLPPNLWDQQNFIDVGEDNVIIGHNVSFDRVRTKRAYDLNKRHDNIWFDTQSMHISTSGLASGQRYFFALKNKNPKDLDAKERKLIKYSPDWSDKGSTNSLVQCFNFHVAEWSQHDKLTIKDKKVRDLFVTANNMKEIHHHIVKLTAYALLDSYYTFLLAKYLWPKYRESSPSYTSLAGHAYLLGSKIPVTNKWLDWISNCELIHQDLLNESSQTITEIAHALYEKWNKLFKMDINKLEDCIRKDGYDILLDGGTEQQVIKLIEEHPILKDELYDKKNNKYKSTLCLNAKGKYRRPNNNTLVKLYTLLNPNWVMFSKAIYKNDVWYNQLDWFPSKYLGKWTPTWYKPWIKDKNHKVTSKSLTMHHLLKLTWRGYPIIKTNNDGLCFIVDNPNADLDEPRIEETYNDLPVHKIPHKKGYDNNVGVLLSKDYLTSFEAEILQGKEKKSGRILEIGVATSYWTSIRKRVMNRFVRNVSNPFGKDALITLPEILPHGTVTRRAVEPLFLTMCGVKSHKLATEFKTRIEAPDGWKIVMADVDAEELQIASIFADKWYGDNVGCSAMTYEILSGDKNKGSDGHTRTAKEMVLNDMGFVFIPNKGWCKEV